MTQSDHDRKEFFNNIASRWDEMRASFFSEPVREKAYAAAGIQAGQLAADVGAGTGFITEGLLRRGLRVISIDQSQAMLAELRRKFVSPNLETRWGLAENLPLDSGSVDAVFANMYLHHVEQPARALQEMARLLKSGGRLVITDLDEHQFEFLRSEQYDRWLGFSRQDVRAWLQAAGLEQVTVDCLGENCCATSGDHAQAASVSIFIACGVKGQAAD